MLVMMMTIGDDIPPVEQLNTPPVKPEAAPHRYPEHQRHRPDYY